jgi:hypothetical protein
MAPEPDANLAPVAIAATEPHGSGCLRYALAEPFDCLLWFHLSPALFVPQLAGRLVALISSDAGPLRMKAG